MAIENPIKPKSLSLPTIGFIFIAIFSLSFHSYLLFHTVAEFVSLIISFSIFILAWNTRSISKNRYLTFVGIAYFFIGSLDLLHTISYKGMNIFKGFNADLPTQLWIAGRYMQSITFLIAPFFLKIKLKENIAFFSYLMAFLIVIATLFIWPVFPVSFDEQTGLTVFKIVSEYIIIFFYILAGIHLFRNRSFMARTPFLFIVSALAVSVLSEIFFTFYNTVYDSFNLIGHLLKIVSAYFLYKALIEASLEDLFKSMLNELQSREMNRLKLIENSPMPMIVTGKDNEIETINRKFSEIFGYSKEELPTLDRWWETLCPEKEYRDRNRARMLKEVEKARKKGTDTPIMDLTLTDRNGVVHYCNFHVVFIQNHSLRIFNDITNKHKLEEERKLLKETYRQNEKMLSLGKLAAGTAHEINNPLAGVMQSLAVLKNRLTLKPGETGPDYGFLSSFLKQRNIERIINTAIMGGHRITNIVNNLLYFTTDDQTEKSYNDMAQLLLETLAMEKTDEDFRKIKIDLKIADELPPVYCDKRRIQQVFHNILRNGTQAFSKMKTSETPLIMITLKASESGDYIFITIGDNGPGMTENVRTMIFEPFFTTREVGAGTGLGLSVSYFIITNDHGGSIDVESTPGEGARFTISLPVNLKSAD